MRSLSSRDVSSALVTGFTTGIIAWRILLFLGHPLPFGIAPGVLVPLIPALWLAGVQLGYLLGMVFRPFVQFGRFAAIGFANAAVDFGVLYAFIAATGLATGGAYAAFKAVSFSVATVHSYLWNKYWAFDAGRSRGGQREVLAFLGVALSSLLVNVGAASVVVALRPATFAVASWAGIGAVVGSAAALVFSFTGFRLFVFNRR
ncbi:MAG: GtrA family protein [Candidatus Yanofskybacteria bacterium]|nr:GtrA family protein [Candidatus Yanofskybacteria bacterium]